MANRSVLLFRVDNHIFENSEQDIKLELEERNEWTGELARVHKFPKGNIIKITFDESNKAKKSSKNRILSFSL